MKRLITDTGGRPFKNPDALQYLQAFDIFEQWFDDLNFGDCIVYGCVISGGVGNYTVTAGVLYISGKLRIFDGVVGVAFPLVLKEEAIDADLREYQEGVNKYTAQLFKMVPDVGGAFNFDLTTPRTDKRFLSKFLNSGINPIVITSASVTIGVITYATAGRTTFLANVQAKFDFTSGGVLDPIVVFGAFSIPEAVLNSEVLIWDSEFGFGVAEISNATPLSLKLKQNYTAGAKTVKVLGAISLA